MRQPHPDAAGVPYPRHRAPRRDSEGYEIAKDEYVRFEPDELKALEQASSSMVAIDSFVPEGAIDPIYFEDTYYLGAGRNGTGGIACSSRPSRRRERRVFLRNFSAWCVHARAD
jgi:hypothetical protein